MDENYYAPAGATVTVTYTAESGRVFKNGTGTLVIAGPASAGGTIAAGQRPLPSNVPFVITVAEGETTGEWTQDGEPVTAETVADYPAIPIEKQGAGTFELQLVHNRNYTAAEGILRANGISVDAAVVTVTVEENGVFDFNGTANGKVTLVANGGTILNNGAEIGTSKRQIENITVNADATIGGPGNFGLSSSSHVANTLALGANTLTKTGANTFWFINTTVTGTGTIDIQEGSIEVYESDSSFPNGTLTGTGTLKVNAGRTFTVGSVGSGLTLTGEGTLKITDRIAYSPLLAEVTLADGATAYFPAGTTHAIKNLALMREGAITITADEGARFEGTFVFPKENVMLTDAFTAAIKKSGYVKRETATEVTYLKPTVLILR